jgi:hypothetical protein
MKLAELVQTRMLDTRSGCAAVLWMLWCLLVKPGHFRVAGVEEVVELGFPRGMLRQVLWGFLMMLGGAGSMIIGVLGAGFILALLATSVVWLPLLFVIAYYRFWRNRRRHAQLLAKARASMGA